MDWQWSSNGAIPGMRCTQFYEPSDSDTWHDNYLCVPRESPLQFLWSSNGALPGIPCWKIDEPADPDTWHDNYLCMHRPQNPPSPSYTVTQPYLLVAPGMGLQAVDVSGTWSSNIGLVYTVSQNGINFDWRVQGLPQTGRGTITGTRNVSASWQDPGGVGAGLGNGEITEVDATGRAIRIAWDNGVVFTR